MLEAKSVAALVLAILLLGLNPAATAAGAEKILLGHLPVTGHAKFFVAKEEGFFEEEGLDVELIDYGNSSDGLAAIHAGQLDLGAFGTVAPLVYIAAGSDIRLIAGIMGEDGFLVATPEIAKTIRDVKDLDGFTIATVRLSSSDAVLRGALMQAGLSWKKDLQILELSSPPAVLEVVKNGQADAGLVWGPHNLIAEQQGLTVVLATADLFPGHPCCRLAVTGERYKAKRDVWPRFLRACLKAERFSQDPDKREKTIADIGKYLNLSPYLIEQSFYHGRLDQTGDPNIESVERIWEILLASEFIHSNFPVRSRIEIAPFLKALDSLMQEEPEEVYWKKVEELFLRRNTKPASSKTPDLQNAPYPAAEPR